MVSRPDDLECLEVFVQRADELRDRRIVRNNDLAANLNIRLDQWHLTYSVNQPDEEDLRSYLLTFRQFVSQKEPVHLDRIYSICFLRLTSDDLKNRLVAARNDWKNSIRGHGIKVAIDDRQMTPMHVTNLLINGGYFHSTDLSLRRELLSLGNIEKLMVQWVFLNFVVDATRQVFFVANHVKLALRSNFFDFAQ